MILTSNRFLIQLQKTQAFSTALYFIGNAEIVL